MNNLYFFPFLLPLSFIISTRAISQDTTTVDTGYGRLSLIDVTGAAQVIPAKDFNRGYVVTADELLIGKASGLNIIKKAGGPASGFQMMLRGRTDLIGQNNPLFVVDGMALKPGFESNPLWFLNPEDIASITILRDAAAASMYGAQAASGVIIINTFYPRKLYFFGVDYNTKLAFNDQPGLLDVLDAETFRQVFTQRFPQQQYMLGAENTNWQKEIYQNGFSHIHQLTIQGGVSLLPYRLSLNISENQGAIKTNQYERMTGLLRVNQAFFQDQLKVDVNLKAAKASENIPNHRVLLNALIFDPTQPLRVSDNFDGTLPGFLADPLTILDHVYHTQDSEHYNMRARVDYSHIYLPELTASFNIGLLENNLINISGVDKMIPGFYPESNFADFKMKQSMAEGFLTYLNNFSDIFILRLTSGISLQNWKHQEEVTGNSLPYQAYMKGTHNGVFGRMHTAFMNRYIFDFSFRHDFNSSYNAVSTDKGMFPRSISFAWVASNEEFLQWHRRIQDLKWRISYGNSGQFMNLAFNNDLPAFSILAFDQKPVKTTFNSGIDLGIRNGFLFLSVDYFNSKVSNALFLIPGYQNLNYVANGGDILSKGVDFSLNTRLIAKRNLLWRVGVNGIYQRSELKNFYKDYPGFKGVQSGNLPGLGYAYIHSDGQKPYSFYVFRNIYDLQGRPLEGMYWDTNLDGRIDDDDLFHFKSPDPDLLMGLSSLLSWKNWDLFISGRYSYGNHVYNALEQAYGHLGQLYNSFDIRNALSSALVNNFSSMSQKSCYFVQDASFFRLDNLTLSYSFHLFNSGDMKMDLSATVNNLFLITSYKGLEPEVPGGIDSGVYPRARYFVFGVRFRRF
jgi:TonB-dependent starch-binding outer membrane protein SusC